MSHRQHDSYFPVWLLLKLNLTPLLTIILSITDPPPIQGRGDAGTYPSYHRASGDY